MSPLPINTPITEIADFCRRHGIARLSLFGIVLREDFSPSSDVDVLVEFSQEWCLVSPALPDCRWNFRGSSAALWT